MTMLLFPQMKAGVPGAEGSSGEAEAGRKPRRFHGEGRRVIQITSLRTGGGSLKGAGCAR